MIFDFPPNTFALFIFPYESAAAKYFAKLSSDLELVKHSQFDLATADTRVMAFAPYMKLRGLQWNGKRPDTLMIHGDVDTGTPWFNLMVIPAMADGCTITRFE